MVGGKHTQTSYIKRLLTQHTIPHLLPDGGILDILIHQLMDGMEVSLRISETLQLRQIVALRLKDHVPRIQLTLVKNTMTAEAAAAATAAEPCSFEVSKIYRL